ncbi:MAG: TatD family hydrolase [Termitinemataceae bacterium]
MGFLIDTHAHISMLSLDEVQLAQALFTWYAEGLAFVLDAGTKAGDCSKRIGQIEKLRTFGGLQELPKILYSAGIWPSNDAIECRRESIEILEHDIQRFSQKHVIAVGECGIDRYWNRPEDGTDVQGERELFAAQLDLAHRYRLPVIVHSREAAQETLEVLRDFPKVQGVIHCFSYDRKTARAFQNLGWYISFAGNVTYKNAEPLREALQEVDPDRLLLETDSPYLAPIPHRGTPATPIMVRSQYELVAHIKMFSVEDLIEQIRCNVTRLFGVDLSCDSK